MAKRSSLRCNAAKAKRERTETLNRKATRLSEIMRHNKPFTGRVATMVENDTGYWTMFLCSGDRTKYPIDFEAGQSTLAVSSWLTRLQKPLGIEFKFCEDFRTEAEGYRDRARGADIRDESSPLDSELIINCPPGTQPEVPGSSVLDEAHCSPTQTTSQQQASDFSATLRDNSSDISPSIEVPAEHSLTSSPASDDSFAAVLLLTAQEHTTWPTIDGIGSSELVSDPAGTADQDFDVPKETSCQNANPVTTLDDHAPLAPSPTQWNAINSTTPQQGESSVSLGTTCGPDADGISNAFPISTSDMSDWTLIENLPAPAEKPTVTPKRLRSGKIWKMPLNQFFNKKRHK